VSDVSPLVAFLFLLLFSLIAPLAYLSWIRKTERYQTEAWGPLLRAFGYGAFVGTFVSLILELIASGIYNSVIQPDLGISTTSTQGAELSLLVLACVIAPFIEEGMKGLGAYSMRTQMRYVADGLVFGAAVGFGFSFIENLLYGVSAWVTGGLAVAFLTIVVRSFSSSLLHGSATAMTGYGIAQNQLRKGQGHAMAGYYLLAVAMHGTFNFLASLTVVLSLLGINNLSSNALAAIDIVSLLAAILYAFAAFGYARDKVTEVQHQPVTVLPVPGVAPPTRP
jgi:protease PrsW